MGWGERERERGEGVEGKGERGKESKGWKVGGREREKEKEGWRLEIKESHDHGPQQTATAGPNLGTGDLVQFFHGMAEDDMPANEMGGH